VVIAQLPLHYPDLLLYDTLLYAHLDMLRFCGFAADLMHNYSCGFVIEIICSGCLRVMCYDEEDDVSRSAVNTVVRGCHVISAHERLPLRLNVAESRPTFMKI